MAIHLSVAMAVHNGAAFLEQQLDSILKQTALPDEIVISDDGSTDQTIEIIENYMPRCDVPIRLVRSQAPGINNNFLQALVSCRGDYIALCDQDDLWHEQKLQLLAAAMDSSTLLAYGPSRLIDSRGEMLPEKGEDYLGFSRYRHGREPLYFLCSNCISGHSMMVARKLLSMALPFPDGIVYDHWLALTAAVQSELVFVPGAVTCHRIHQKNAVNNRSLVKERKHNTPKRSKSSRYYDQRRTLLHRLQQARTLGCGLSEEEKNFIDTMYRRVQGLDNRVFDLPLFRALYRHRNHLFHLPSLRQCRNLAIGGAWYRLMDRLLGRACHHRDDPGSDR